MANTIYNDCHIHKMRSVSFSFFFFSGRGEINAKEISIIYLDVFMFHTKQCLYKITFNVLLFSNVLTGTWFWLEQGFSICFPSPNLVFRNFSFIPGIPKKKKKKDVCIVIFVVFTFFFMKYLSLENRFMYKK